MVVLSQPAFEHVSLIKAHKPTTLFNGIPVVDLSDPSAKTLIVKACEEFGFFKVVNHGVPVEFLNRLESEALKFFNMSQSQKDMAGPADPFGYGNKKIGPNGDVGWIEYLLFNTSPDIISQNSIFILQDNPENFR